MKLATANRRQFLYRAGAVVAMGAVGDSLPAIAGGTVAGDPSGRALVQQLRRSRRAGPGSSPAGIPGRLLPRRRSQGRSSDPRRRARLRPARCGDRRGGPLGQFARCRCHKTGRQSADCDRWTAAGRSRRRTLLRRYRRLVPSHDLVRAGPEKPDPGILRCRRGKCAQDHRRRAAATGEVLL